MIDPRAERRAYFASLATPDLIVCATVERTSFSADDLEIIQTELIRRGVDPSRLAQPEEHEASPLWPTVQQYSTPLPRTADWWKEGWQLFQRYFGFLSLLAAVLFLPEYILRNTIRLPYHGGISLALIADTFLAIGFQALYAGAVMQALCRFMRTGHCSIGRAVGIGMERWTCVFRNQLKALAIAFGVPYLLVTLGYATDEAGLVALGVILIIYPGIYLGLRYIWVEPIAALDPGSPNPLVQSKMWVANNYRRILKFVILGIVILIVVQIGTEIVKAILPGQFLESLAEAYITVLFQMFLLTTLLVGYIHMRFERQNGAASAPSTPATEDQLPPPPPLPTS